MAKKRNSEFQKITLTVTIRTSDLPDVMDALEDIRTKSADVAPIWENSLKVLPTTVTGAAKKFFAKNSVEVG